MTPKERAEFTLNRVNRWLLAGNREVAAYHIEQAIIAAQKEGKIMKWQPIETAPKDGTWILLRGKNSLGLYMIPVVAAWRTGHTGAVYGWYDSGSLKNLDDLAADGAEWIPLPDAE